MLKSFVQVNNGPRQEKEMWLGGGDKSKEKNNVGDTVTTVICIHNLLRGWRRGVLGLI